MKSYFFFNTLRKTIVQYFDLFNNIKIARYASDGKTINRHVTVPIKHSVKEKMYYWLNERKDDKVLPIISSYISSIDYAADRKVNSFHSFPSSCDLENSGVSTYLHPVPYNIMFTMNIWSLHVSDIDQILEQILPFFSPHVFIRIAISDLNTAFDAKVIFRSAVPEVTHEMTDEDYRVLNYTLDFEVNTWLFKPSSDVGLIKKIYGSYPTTNMALDTTSTFTSGASGGPPVFEIKGRVDEDGEILSTYRLFES